MFALAAIVLAEIEVAPETVLVEVDTEAQRLVVAETELKDSSGMQQAVAVKPVPAQLASQSDSSPLTVLASAHETVAVAAGSVVVATHTSAAS